MTSSAIVRFNEQGYAVDAYGAVIHGFRLDSEGRRLRSAPEPLRAPLSHFPASRTTKVTYAANLPPMLDLDRRAPFLSGLSGESFHILGCDAGAFLDASMAGGSTVVYNADGIAARMHLRWMKLEPGLTGAWALLYLCNRKATFTDAAWRSAQTFYRFQPGSRFLTCSNEFADVRLNGVMFGDFALVHSPGITHHRELINAVKVNTLAANGKAAASTKGLKLNPCGEMMTHYDND
jgi:flagellar hook protein FlgE